MQSRIESGILHNYKFLLSSYIAQYCHSSWVGGRYHKEVDINVKDNSSKHNEEV